MAIRVGKVETIDMETGRVVEVKFGAGTLLPPHPSLCQECATAHGPDAPHNRDSFYYGVVFKAKHGRYPTWTDAMKHCPEATRMVWRSELIGLMKEKGMTIPPDLRGEAGAS